MRARPILSTVPRVSLPVVLTVLGAHLALKGLYFSPAWLHGVALPLDAATGGLLTVTTAAGLVSWLVLIGAGLFGLARLSAADLGLSRQALVEALPVLVGTWLTVQVALGALGAAAGGPLAATGAPSWTAAVGLRLQAVVGSGLLEEVLYRGFLLVQVYAWLRRRRSAETALVAALVASSVYFGLNHIPAGLQQGLGAADLAIYVGQCVLGGALFASLFVRTGNLWVAAGAHALINDPVALFASAVDPSLVALVAVALLLLAWPLLGRQFGARFTVGTLEGRPAL